MGIPRRTARNQPVRGDAAPARFVALIADVVRSRRFEGSDRQDLQDRLAELVEHLNRAAGMSLAGRFVLTIGDEFQGLLTDARPLPDLCWAIGAAELGARLRLGVGAGAIHTERRTDAIGMDGPAFHAARRALELAEAQHAHGGVFLGFGPGRDRSLTALAFQLDHLRSSLKPDQRSAIDLLRQGRSQTEVAKALGKSPQSVSRSLARAGWPAIRIAERSLRSDCEAFDLDPEIADWRESTDAVAAMLAP